MKIRSGNRALHLSFYHIKMAILNAMKINLFAERINETHFKQGGVLMFARDLYCSKIQKEFRKDLLSVFSIFRVDNQVSVNTKALCNERRYCLYIKTDKLFETWHALNACNILLDN